MSWFRFYPDDFLGGVLSGSLSATDSAHYLFLLMAQFGSKERRAIPADPASLRRMCFGEEPGPQVLAKFLPVTVDGQNYLRNNRMAEEWDIAASEYEARKRGAERGANRTAERDAERGGERVAAGADPGTMTRTQEKDAGTGTEPPAPPAPPPVPAPQPDLELFVRVFARAYDRRFKVVPKLNEKARRHFRGMVRAYGREATCCLPILARSYDARREGSPERVKERAVAHLFHDGQNDRFDWSTLLQKADTLDPERLPLIWTVAREFGLESGLEKLGVPHPLEVDLPSPRQDPPPASVATGSVLEDIRALQRRVSHD